VSISSADDTNCTEKSDSKYDWEHECDVDMHLGDAGDAPDSDDFDGDVDMERDGDDNEQEDEEQEDEEKEIEEAVEEEDEDEEADKDEDNGKEPRMIGQREIVNSSADDVNAMVDDPPIMLPE
jgi:hypothetical protein